MFNLDSILFFLFVGSITCAAYPLSQIDTIDNETGDISKDSALNLVVFGVSYYYLLLLITLITDNKLEKTCVLYQ